MWGDKKGRKDLTWHLRLHLCAPFPPRFLRHGKPEGTRLFCDFSDVHAAFSVASPSCSPWSAISHLLLLLPSLNNFLSLPHHTPLSWDDAVPPWAPSRFDVTQHGSAERRRQLSHEVFTVLHNPPPPLSPPPPYHRSDPLMWGWGAGPHFHMCNIPMFSMNYLSLLCYHF